MARPDVSPDVVSAFVYRGLLDPEDRRNPYALGAAIERVLEWLLPKLAEPGKVLKP